MKNREKYENNIFVFNEYHQCYGKSIFFQTKVTDTNTS